MGNLGRENRGNIGRVCSFLGLFCLKMFFQIQLPSNQEVLVLLDVFLSCRSQPRCRKSKGRILGKVTGLNLDSARLHNSICLLACYFVRHVRALPRIRWNTALHMEWPPSNSSFVGGTEPHSFVAKVRRNAEGRLINYLGGNTVPRGQLPDYRRDSQIDRCNIAFCFAKKRISSMLGLL